MFATKRPKVKNLGAQHSELWYGTLYSEQSELGSVDIVCLQTMIKYLHDYKRGTSIMQQRYSTNFPLTIKGSAEHTFLIFLFTTFFVVGS